MNSDTIAAIATPPGEGGISVIRLSGPKSIEIADTFFSRSILNYTTHTCHVGKIIDDGRVIDQVLLIIMRNPKSYTGEDIVEIQCHGGSLVTKQILECLVKKGARLAEPGEFTYRAFLNGKLDLAQAEAVQTFIGAKNHHALDAASDLLQGKLSKMILSFQQELLDTAAILEAWVDFPEEGLEFASKSEVIAQLSATKQKILQLHDTFEEGRKIHEGLSLCLCGAPNAGKSSLMNQLLGHERAIVTNIAGTTRDTLDAQLHLSGLHFRLIDTAGIRQTEEIVEREGIKRSRKEIETADLVLLVIDQSKPLSKEDNELLSLCPEDRTIVVWNKIDLPSKIIFENQNHQVAICAKTGEGLNLLKQKIEEIIWKNGPPSKEELVLTQQRHKNALFAASEDLQTIIDGLQTETSAEFLSSDMRSCLEHLSSIIGIDISEEILSSIFSKFCVGK